MKKSILIALAGVLSFTLMQNASAFVTVENGTGARLFIFQNHHMTKLFPNQFTQTATGSFNVLVDNPNRRGLVTVCTIHPVFDGDVVRIHTVLNPTTSGGCLSFYRYE